MLARLKVKSHGLAPRPLRVSRKQRHKESSAGDGHNRCGHSQVSQNQRDLGTRRASWDPLQSLKPRERKKWGGIPWWVYYGALWTQNGNSG